MIEQVKQFAGSDTKHWYQSRQIWLGTAQILWGLYQTEFEWISTGIGTIWLRFTKNNPIRRNKKQ